MDVELRQLRYLLAVADHRSIGAAAKSLHLTAPSLARQLADVERRVGAPLLERGRGGTSLTAGGWELVQRLRPALQELDATLSSAQPRVGGQRLRVACQADSTNGVLVPLLRAASQLPGLHVDPQVLPRPRQLVALAAGRLDLGLLWSPVSEPNVRAEPFFDMPVCAMFPAEHPLAAAHEVKLAALAGETWLAVRNPGGIDRDGELRARYRALGVEVLLTQPVQDLVLGLALVAAGQALMAAPASLLAAAPASVRAVPIAGWTVTLTAVLPPGPVSAPSRRLLGVAAAVLSGEAGAVMPSADQNSRGMSSIDVG